MTTTEKAGLRPVPSNLFPTMNSSQELIDYATSLLPITDKNTVINIIMVTQNTILKLQQGS